MTLGKKEALSSCRSRGGGEFPVNNGTTPEKFDCHEKSSTESLGQTLLQVDFKLTEPIYAIGVNE